MGMKWPNWVRNDQTENKSGYEMTKMVRNDLGTKWPGYEMIGYRSPHKYSSNRAASWQNQQNGICAQRRLRSSWASAQSDQSSLSAWRKLGSLANHWAHSEDSYQTGPISRLIWVIAGRTCHFVGFVVRRLIILFSLQNCISCWCRFQMHMC